MKGHSHISEFSAFSTPTPGSLGRNSFLPAHLLYRKARVMGAPRGLSLGPERGPRASGAPTWVGQ